MRLQDLERIPLVLPPEPHGIRLVVDEAFEKHGIRPNIVLKSIFWTVVTEVVRKGITCTLLPPREVKSRAGDGSLHSRRSCVSRRANGGRLEPLGCKPALNGASPPYPDLLPFTAQIRALGSPRYVWGSDWPHSNFSGHMPNTTDLLDVLFDWEADANAWQKLLVDNPARLYGFSQA